MSKPVAEVYKAESRVLQLENEELIKDFREHRTYRVEKI